MTFAIRSEPCRAGEREGEKFVLSGPGCEAEVWPTHGFNCLRWAVKAGDLLYRTADWEQNPVPTRSGVPILPVGVSGSDLFLGRGRRFPGIGTRITLRVGRPFTVALEPGESRRRGMQKASDEIMRRVAELADERHRGRFGDSGPV